MPAPGGEDDLIARFFAPLAGEGGLGLLDDAALLRPPPGQDLVLTADAIVAGVHVLPDDPAASVARKALGVNLSDLAAKGAGPMGFLLTLALPAGWTEAWLAEFCEGLGETSRRHGCPLLGGDTVATPGPLVVSITAIGAVPAGRMVRRTTARPGDLVCVTGTIGDAVLGLALSLPDTPGWAAALDPAERAFLVDRYRHPQPRTAFAAALRESASAAMDVSDGLTGDLAKLLRVSGVGGVLDLDAIPLSPACRAALARDASLRDRMIGGGDDYEVLFTLPPDRLPKLLRDAAYAGIAVTSIGEVTADPALEARDAGVLRPLTPASYSHVRT